MGKTDEKAGKNRQKKMDLKYRKIVKNVEKC